MKQSTSRSNSAECFAAIEHIIEKADDRTEALHQITGIVHETFQCDRVFLLYPCDPYAHSWSAIEYSKNEYPGIAQFGHEMTMDDSVAEGCKLILEHKDVIAFGSGAQYPVSEMMQMTFDIRSMLAMALFTRTGKPWNFGIQQCAHDRVWNDEEIKLFRQIALRIATAIPELPVRPSTRQ